MVFKPGRSTTDAIYTLEQMQEKHLSRKQKTSFTFVGLEKAFDRVLCFVLWWAMRKLGIDEWTVSLVKVMYDDPNSKVRVNSWFSEKHELTVGVHQGSILSPLLLTIVMEALSHDAWVLNWLLSGAPACRSSYNYEW